ncbi:MAG: VCBS repeat-containing protein [Planctomycetes bacterium]|nr:VCBS repeat-containing protein [Planctomycetota bacterium]
MAENPEPVTTIGDYRIVREIGRGGMGVVYLAEHVSLRRTVALKVLPAHLTLRSEVVRRFRQEASLAARLRHPGIVQIFDVGEAEGAHFIAMEFVDGTPLDVVIERLDEFIDRPGEVEGSRIGSIVSPSPQVSAWNRSYVSVVCRMAIQIADALEHAHRAGVIHRDVKPANVLVRGDGSVVLTDFGLARDEGMPSLTATGEFAGTPYYVSPEQALARRETIDHRTDVFSLGVTLYELLTLHRPFEGKTSQDVLGQIISAEPPSPRRWSPTLPRELSTIILKALEKDPNRRYSSAAAFGADLRALLEFKPIAARPASAVSRILKLARRHRAATAAVVVVALGVATATGWWWAQPGTLEITSPTDGATIYVDGRPITDRTSANAPVRLKVTPGVHRVRLEKRGDTEDLVADEQEVVVPRAATKPLDRALMSLNGAIKLDSDPQGAHVKLLGPNGREIVVGRSTPVIDIVRSGRYRAVFELNGFPSKSELVDVKPGGESVECKTVWETGDMVLDGLQDGIQVEVFRGEKAGGGRSIQAVTLPHQAPLRLPTGTYSLRARAAEHDARDWDDRQAIRVATGQTTRVGIWLPPIERLERASIDSAIAAILTADLDGDGRPEIVAASNDGSIVCVPPRGLPRFRVEIGEAVRRLIAADLDGDGRRDVVAGSFFGSIIALGADGSRRFETKVGEHLEQVVAVDLDGDGRSEIVAAGYSLANRRDDYAGTILALSSEGTTRWRAEVSGQPSRLLTTLVDADGRPLIVAGTQSRIGGEIVAFAADGARRFGIATEGNVTSLVTADVDHDGRADVIAGMSDGEILAMSPDGKQLFSERIEGSIVDLLATVLGGERQPGIVAATGNGRIIVLAPDGSHRFEESVDGIVEELLAVDIDRDGKPEIVARTSSGRIVAVWTDDWHVRDVKAEGHVVRFASADLDGDGRLEIVAASDTGQVLVLAPAGFRRFEVKFAEELTDLAVTDVDQDGHAELVVGTAGGKIVSLSPTWRESFAAKADGVVDLLVACDIDGDGRPESIVTTETGQIIALSVDGTRRLEHRVSGRVRAIVPVTLDGRAAALAQSENGELIALVGGTSKRFDVGTGSGKVSGLAAATAGGEKGSTWVVSARGSDVDIYDSAGHETATVQLDSEVMSVATGDVFEDGVPEIVAGTGSGEIVVIGLDGEVRANHPIGGGVKAIAVADLDGDRRPEIVALTAERGLAAWEASRVIALSSNGVVRFNVSVDGEAHTLTVGDLDGDGRAEVVVAAQTWAESNGRRQATGGRVLVLAGDGTERFDRRIDGDGRSIAVADLDGDGRSEIIVDSAGVMALTFDGSVRFHATADSGGRLLVADVDGDRRPEIVAGGLGNEVVVLDGDGSCRFSAYTQADIKQVAVSAFDPRRGARVITGDRLGNVISWQIPRRDPRAPWRRDFFDALGAAERGDEKRADALFQRSKLRWIGLDDSDVAWAFARLRRATSSPTAQRMAAIVEDAGTVTTFNWLRDIRALAAAGRTRDALEVARLPIGGAKPDKDAAHSLTAVANARLLAQARAADVTDDDRDLTLAIAQAAVERDGRVHVWFLEVLGCALEARDRALEAKAVFDEALLRCPPDEGPMRAALEADLARVRPFAEPQDPASSGGAEKKPDR